MGPTSEPVGPATGIILRAVARLTPYGLETPAKQGVANRTNGATPGVRRGARLKSAILLRLVLFTFGYFQVQLDASPDPYASEYAKPPPEIGSYLWKKSQRAAIERQEGFRVRVAIPDAVGENALADYNARRVASQNGITSQLPTSASPEMGRQILLLGSVMLLAGMLAVRKLAPELITSLNQQFNPWVMAPALASNYSMAIRAEDEAISQFSAAFQTGPLARLPSDTTAAPSAEEVYPFADFHARAARLLVTQRKLLEEIVKETDKPARQRMLADLCREICVLKGEAGRPDVLLVWQLASALEGLLKQLTNKAENVTASTLRTIAGGVDLLADLCLPGLRPDLLSVQPLRFLAVDDDLISRKAISLALKKVLNQPDLAENGETALALATRQAYDVIFLDVQMPGMDGFELCTKIHATDSNSTTPVVFVTVLSDFDAHAKSTLSGGSDLMGKPFLTFEVTVKALTLALRGRLQGRTLPATAKVEVHGPVALPKPRANTSPALAVQEALPEESTDCARSSQSLSQRRSPEEPAIRTVPPGEADNTLTHESVPEIFADKFLARASAQLASMQDLFQAVFQTEDESARQEMLAEVYLCLHALAPKNNAKTLHPAMQVCGALEGLLRKLLEDPKQATPSTLVTLGAGVDLFQDLCVPGLKSDLGSNPPIRMLVVDDDPLARRAVVCALQMAFEKPDAAENGEAALALATGKPFDVIFLDVQMPGMDGFTVCSKIREAGCNRRTPVVFVTGHADFNARTQMSRCGGNDFVGKPFLKSEITLKALTFALRGRLEKIATARTSASVTPVG